MPIVNNTSREDFIMTFEFILNLIDSNYSKNSPLANKKVFIYDSKNRLMEDFTFYDGYSITEESKTVLKKFCESQKSESLRFFVVRLYEDSICIYDEFRGFIIKLDRAS